MRQVKECDHGRAPMASNTALWMLLDWVDCLRVLHEDLQPMKLPLPSLKSFKLFRAPVEKALPLGQLFGDMQDCTTLRTISYFQAPKEGRSAPVITAS